MPGTELWVPDSARGFPIHSLRVPSGAIPAAATGAIAVLTLQNSAAATAEFALLEAGIFWAGDTGPITTRLARVTAVPTGGTQVTPDIDNSHSGSDVKINVLGYGGPYTTQPTIGKILPSYTGGAAAGARGNGYVWTFPEGVRTKEGPGQGFGIFLADAVNALATGSECYFVWEERSN